MTPERFRQIEELASLVLQVGESERAAFLDQACSGDRELRREVESLLASDEKAQGFLGEPAARLVVERLADDRGEERNVPPSPAAVGRYRIERELGRGGMGLVYAAYDPELGRKVAIKLVRPASSARIDPTQGRARLLREAQAMAQLTHPNVAAIYDVGTYEDRVFIAMEYGEGSTLSAWLSSERRSWREIVSMFAQCARGLAAAHAKKIVHRDFKPDNVWVGEDGRARVLDFGLARATSGEGEDQPIPRAPAGHEETAPPRATMLRSTITQPGTLLGTPPYMPPEQLRGELGDARSDQFSFCVALYHALYGEFPFRSETLPALLGEIERRKIGEPPKFRRIPTWLRRVLLRGLSPDPAGRHESMDTLLRELAPRGRLPRRLFLIPSLLASAAVALVLARTEWDPTTEITSIAVLPLKNLSGDSQKAYFADGITEALITELGKIRALRVLSYQSVRNYRDTAKPLPQLARELQVGAFLEGAVLQSGGRVRITINLLQSSPERHLWAESYDFDLRDVLSVQAEVARDVASRIRVEVTPPEQARLKSARRVDSDAYQSYLLGRAHMSKAPTAENWARAKEYFEKAIEKDPEYAPAYAGLAELYIRHRQWRNHKEARLLARRWGEKALQLDDTLAEAHTVLARCAQQDWDWAGTERGFRRAIELNPSYALARLWYAMYLYAMGRFDEAVVEARRAQQLDPVSPLVNSWAGAAYLFAGRAEEALASAQKALELDPSFSDASIVLARIYVTQGKYREGIDELQRALTINPRQPLLLGALAHAYARAGQREEALNLVAEMKRIEAEEPGYAPFNMVYAYAGLGDKEQAFAYLERAYQERAGRMVWMNVDKYLDPLRSDPRFEDLVRRVGLPTQPSPQPR